MTATTKATSNGGTVTRISHTESGDGLAKLRREETKSLISLACEAMYQTNSVAHQMHSLIYGKDGEFRPDQLDRMSKEALTCWQTADHYLRMLGCVLADYFEDAPPF